MQLVLRSLAVCAALCLGGPSPGRAEEFSFRMKDGTVLLAQAHREIASETAGTARKELNTEETLSEWRFLKTRSGYDAAVTQKRAVRQVNGVPFKNPAADGVLLGRTLTMRLDERGLFISLTGHENIAAEMKRLFPQAAPAQLDATLAPALLEGAQRRSWWIHTARLAGREAAPGSRWEDREDFPGQRPAAAYGVSQVAEVKPFGNRSLATVFFFLSSDASLLAKLKTAEIRNLADPAVRDFLEWNVAGLPLQKLAVRQVLDVRTMEPAEEEIITVRVGATPAGLQTQREAVTTTWQGALRESP